MTNGVTQFTDNIGGHAFAGTTACVESEAYMESATLPQNVQHGGVKKKNVRVPEYGNQIKCAKPYFL